MTPPAPRAPAREAWSSRAGFVLASICSEDVQDEMACDLERLMSAAGVPPKHAVGGRDRHRLTGGTIHVVWHHVRQHDFQARGTSVVRRAPPPILLVRAVQARRTGEA